MNASTRKALGAAAIIVFLFVYVAGAAAVGEQLHGSPWLSLGFYALAGVLWVVPLRPLFAWMHPKEDGPTQG